MLTRRVARRTEQFLGLKSGRGGHQGTVSTVYRI
jgi:hypothetical protein